MRSTLSSRRRVAILYGGVVVFLALAWFTARSMGVAWRAHADEARAEAMLSLVAERTPARPTSAPGAMAWLRLELDRYEQRIPDRARAALFRGLAAPSARVPDVLAPLAHALAAAAAPGPSAGVQIGPPREMGARASLRRERLATLAHRSFVVTRDRWLDAEGDTASNQFVQLAVPMVDARESSIAETIAARPLPAVPDATAPHIVRVYVVAEDGTLVSAPWGPSGAHATDLGEELALLAGRPGVPSFAPQDFFFHFDPATPSAPPAYSGLYLDLGGRGLVSTITVPLDISGRRVIAALDLAFDIDWQALAAAAEPPIAGAAVRVSNAGAASWISLDAAMPAGAPPPLRDAVRALADGERQSGVGEDSSPLRHGIVPGGGAVAAFQASDAVWLLMFFPPATPAFPLAAVGLLAAVLAMLFAGFEFNRRRAEDERQKAESVFAEKQNLLNTMQVPLVVVDPNSDVIISSNRAAAAIGVKAGARFADIVWPDDRSRAHYERMQVASPEPRRAYGLPVAVRDEHGQVSERYAVIRSVAVTAPIEALAADERHRLGVLFVLDEADDLSLFAEVVDARAHREERQRLAGLLTHGVDTLARVLEHCLTTPPQAPARQAFATWLAGYLERRLTVTGWLLDHWDAALPLARDSIVDVEQVRATIERLAGVLSLVGDDRDLRLRLHWDNGTLSAPARTSSLLDVAIDWPESFVFTLPIAGGAGMFIGEVVANAVRHGQPGTTPTIAISADRVRRELRFRVENETRDVGEGEPRGETYGGLAMLRAIARLFDWREVSFRRTGTRFVAEWIVPASLRGRAGEAD